MIHAEGGVERLPVLLRSRIRYRYFVTHYFDLACLLLVHLRLLLATSIAVS